MLMADSLVAVRVSTGARDAANEPRERDRTMPTQHVRVYEARDGYWYYMPIDENGERTDGGEGVYSQPYGTRDEALSEAANEWPDVAIDQLYVVECWEQVGNGGQWTPYGIGDNAPRSEEQCERDIESLRALGNEWAAAEYRVREAR